MKFKRILVQAFSIVLLASGSNAAIAAYSFALAEYTGITDVRTFGSATATVVSETAVISLGEATSPLIPAVMDDPFNDGVTFESEISSTVFGSSEGTAINSGVAAASLAEAFSTSGAPHNGFASTASSVALDMDGMGIVEVDFGFSLLVDSFDNDETGFALASIEAWGGIEGLVASELLITDSDVTGIGTLDILTGVLTLSFYVDGPTLEYATIFTNAEVGIIPIPAAVWLFGSAVIGLVGFRKK